MNNIDVSYEESYEIGPEKIRFQNCSPSSMKIDENILMNWDFSKVKIYSFSVQHYLAVGNTDDYFITCLDIILRSGGDKSAVLRLKYLRDCPNLDGLMDIMSFSVSIKISYKFCSYMADGDISALWDNTSFDITFSRFDSYSGETKVWNSSPAEVSLQEQTIDK